MSNYYGNVDPDISRKYKDENEREYRNRLRNEIVIKISVWNKSPPPPSIAKKQKDKVVNKIPIEDKPIDKPLTDQFGRELHKISNYTNQNENNQIVNNNDLESSSRSSSSSSTSSSSSYVKRKKHGKNKKKQQKDQKASKHKSKSKKHSEKKKYSSSSSDSSDNENDEYHKKSKSKRLKTESSSNNKTISITNTTTATQSLGTGFNEYDQEEANRFRQDVQGTDNNYMDGDSDMEELGPKPMVQPKEYSENKTISYGGALMPGEGAAIAQFVQQNLRIPRRGEIGWQGTEIENLEQQGFVMSGSRHARMNAIRLRKENQVYSAEEKRALALITFEEKQQKENKIVGDFRSMLTKKNVDNLTNNNDDNY